MLTPRLKSLQEEKGKLAYSIRQLADKINAESRDFTSEEQAEWDRINATYESVQKQIGVEQRAAEVSRVDADPRRPELAEAPAARQSGVSDEDRAVALQGFLLQGTARQRNEHVEAMERVGLRGANEITLRLAPSAIGANQGFQSLRERFLSTPRNQRADLHRGPSAASLLTSSTSAAGYLIAPGTLVGSLELARLWYGNVLQLARVVRTNNGEALSFPTANDTGNTGELLAEVGSIGSTVNPSVGRKTLNAYKFSSKLIRFSYEMMEDSAFDLMSLLGGMLGERLGRVGNTYQTVGTGSSEPEGIVTGSYAGKTAASATAITADEIIDLYHSLDIAYRPNASFMAADATFKSLRKLKASGGEYLWKAGGLDASLSSGFEDTLFGKPAITNSDMPAMTTGLKSMLFGDFSKFAVREVNEVRLQVLRELYAGTDELGIIAFMRWDSKVIDAGTHPIMHLVQA